MNAGSHNSQNSFLNFVKYEATWTLPNLKAKAVFPWSGPKATCTPELWSPLYQFSFHVGLGLGLGIPSFFSCPLTHSSTLRHIVSFLSATWTTDFFWLFPAAWILGCPYYHRLLSLASLLASYTWEASRYQTSDGCNIIKLDFQPWILEI